MMHKRDFFTPEQVDQQVDQFSPESPIIRLPRRRQGEKAPQAEECLVSDLQGYYQDEQDQDLASLERAWQRVSPHLASGQELPRSTDQSSSVKLLRSSHERTRMMSKQVSDRPRKGKFARGLSTLAAVLVAALLVGGLVAVLKLSHQPSALGSRHTPKITPTPTTPPLAIGTTVYTTPSDPQGYSAFSWSPDSKRIASINSKGIQIWDATTGQHRVTAQLPGQNEWAWNILWSPNSQDIAVGTNQEILLVNGQTGAAIRSFSSGVVSVNTPNFSGTSYLSSQFPASGGFGYRSISWSPDGHSIAAAISFGASGAIQIWNTQTGTVASTFQVSGSYVVGSVAWSSDGKYLAAHAYHSQPTDMTNQPPMDDHIMVWNVTTRQLVFQHTDGLQGSDAPIFWQPQSDNLAFVGTTHSGSDYLSTLEIWNVITGQQVKQFVGTGGMSMVWSPDGKDLAYSGAVGTGKNTVNAIIIMDASSGQQIYAYKAPPASVITQGGPLAWSPDGKYIVSAQGGGMGFTNGKMTPVPGVALVWVA